MKRAHSLRRLAHPRGFSLVELMISLVLGLLVVGAVTSIFLSNKQSYGTNEALGEVQDNSRIAFELLARDIRQAGLAGCGSVSRVANVLNNGPNGPDWDPDTGATQDNWWADFGDAIRGYDGNMADPAVSTGTGAAARVSGTSSVELFGPGDTGLTVADHPNGPTAANFHTDPPATGYLQQGDIILVCDPDHAAITQVTSTIAGGSVRVDHNASNSGNPSPGNCSKGLGFPTDCSSENGNSYIFQKNAQIATLKAVDWYIGNNPQSGRSLYRRVMVNSGGTPATTAQEMVRNVTDMQITYHINGGSSFVSAANVTAANDWARVDAVQVSLTFISTSARAGTSNQALSRQLTTTITLRNRTS